ncbi:MAG: hypothetical protein ACLUFV_12975 [Acutalibacteraceae bacterium]
MRSRIKAHYYPDASFFATSSSPTGRPWLLGIQVLGPGAVDKLVDIAVMAVIGRRGGP